MIRKILFILALLLSVISFSDAQYFEPLFQPTNLDFETGEKGSNPLGWKVPSYARKLGYIAFLVEENPKDGRYCYQLAGTGRYVEEKYGSVMQSIDAGPYRGKTIRFRAAVRARITSRKGSAHLWIREHLINDQQGTFERMEDNPIVSNQWDYYQIEVNVSPYAKVLNFGLLMFGTGYAWIDDASIEVVSEDTTAVPPKQLTKTGLDNLVSFTKLLSYVAFFHPTEEAKYTDWEKFTLTGIEHIENAETQEALRDSLYRLFKPIAPTLKIFTQNKPPENIKFETPPNALKNIELAWIQQMTDISRDNVRSERSRIVNIYQSQRKANGVAMQIINAKDLAGKKIEFGSYVKTKMTQPGSHVEFWLRVDDEKEQPIFKKAMQNNPITSSDWKKFSIEAELPENTATIRAGLVLIGEGEAWFDEVFLKYLSQDVEEDFTTDNPGFENGRLGIIPKSWVVPQNSKFVGYKAYISDEDPYKDEKCLKIESDTASQIKLPEPGSIIKGALERGLSFALPLTVHIDSNRSVPYPSDEYPPLTFNRSASFNPNGKDRTSRLGIIISAWNLLKHFSLYKIPEDEWEKALKEALTAAAVDKADEEFIRTLRKMLAYWDDSNSRAWIVGDQPRYGAPFLWSMIKDDLTIIKVFDKNSGLDQGDIVEKIDGFAAKTYLDREKQYVPGAADEWKTIRALAKIKSGVQGTKLKLKVRKNSGETKEINLKRNTLLSKMTEKRPPMIAQLDSSIYYVDLTGISDEILKDTVEQLKKAKGIIFDARGATSISEHFLGLFIKSDIKSAKWLIPRYTKPDHELISHKKITGIIDSAAHFIDADLVFLSDTRSIGYTEAILSLVKYHKLGEIIGRKTAGAGSESIPIKLFGNYNFSMTGMKCIDPSGNHLFGNPVMPTIRVPETEKIIGDNDIILQSGYEYLNNLIKNK